MNPTELIIPAVGWVRGIWRHIRHIRDKRLTKAEKELLAMAFENRGEMHLLESDQTGPFARIGRHSLYDSEDPNISADYLEALDKLVSRGLAKAEGAVRLCLTGTGFNSGRKFRKRK